MGGANQLMEQWLIDTFGPADNRGYITVGLAGNSFPVRVTPAVLAAQLPGIAVPPTHAALSSTAAASTGGWQDVFDQWKAKGIVQ